MAGSGALAADTATMPAVPELAPFRGLRYDPRAAADLSGLLCPPYDVITQAQREALAAADAHNAVRLELPVAASGGDPYQRAAALFADWQARGVLRLDERPMVYVYEQLFAVPGRPAELARARGFFCRLRLEEPGAGVRRHERTMAAPKEDRLRLLRAVRANLSPVLLLYRSDKDGAASRQALDELSGQPPEAIAQTGEGETHRLWAVEPDRVPAAALLLELAGGGPLTIADGHHRYETALRYRDEVGGPGADEILVLLYDAVSGGLVVLPTHRLLRGMPETESLLAGAGELFEMELQQDAVTLEARLGAAGGGTIGLWTHHGGALMRPRREVFEKLLPPGSAALRGLDVVVLGAALERLTGLTAEQLDEQRRLVYTKGAAEAVASVEAGQADASFLLNATPILDVLDVAGAGELMPAKSTYFVPKAGTGLVFNLLSA